MQTYEASVRNRFKATHAVPLADGRMEDVHEHVWETTAVFRSEKLAEPMGVVADFNAVQEALRLIGDELEDANLSDLPEFKSRAASAERVAEYLAGRLAAALGKPLGDMLYCLQVTEADGCVAACYPRGA